MLGEAPTDDIDDSVGEADKKKKKKKSISLYQNKETNLLEFTLQWSGRPSVCQ